MVDFHCTCISQQDIHQSMKEERGCNEELNISRIIKISEPHGDNHMQMYFPVFQLSEAMLANGLRKEGMLQYAGFGQIAEEGWYSLSSYRTICSMYVCTLIMATAKTITTLCQSPNNKKYYSSRKRTVEDQRMATCLPDNPALQLDR